MPFTEERREQGAPVDSPGDTGMRATGTLYDRGPLEDSDTWNLTLDPSIETQDVHT